MSALQRRFSSNSTFGIRHSDLTSPMLALVKITGWHWIGFIVCVLIFLALDLRVFHRQAHTVKFREALIWTTIWFCLAMLFAWGLKPLRGEKEALEFVTGY